MSRWPLFRSQLLYITRLLYSPVLQAKSQQGYSSNSTTAWRIPPIRVSQASHQGDHGATEATASAGSSLSEQEPHVMTPHFSTPRVPKTATQAGHSCYKEGFPVWLQIPLSPRQVQEQDAGARAGSAPTVSSHQEMCLPSIFWGVIRVRPQS